MLLALRGHTCLGVWCEGWSCAEVDYDRDRCWCCSTATKKDRHRVQPVRPLLSGVEVVVSGRCGRGGAFLDKVPANHGYLDTAMRDSWSERP
jgi:hypothetical protein